MSRYQRTRPYGANAKQDAEEASVEDAAKLSSRLLYEIIRRDGEEEMARTNRSLFWSGVAAGLMISFSVVTEAVFRTYLPDVSWRFLIENIGYSLGFILVILGRMQLFTENTITTVLPLMVKPTKAIFAGVLRLWGIVLAANVVGCFAIALLYAHTPALPAEMLPAMHKLSEHAMEVPMIESFFRAIPAGILIAALVWMLPQSSGFEIFTILIFTWLIAAGDFMHIVAGSVEMAYLIVLGDLGLASAVFGFFIPVLIGNVLGGTLVFALMVWGQVRDEYVARKS